MPDLVDSAIPFEQPVEEVAPPPADEPIKGVSADGNGLESLIVKIPDSRRPRAIVGSDEVGIERLPLRICCAATGEGKDTCFDIDLTLDDERPFNLPRANPIRRSVFALSSNSFSRPLQAG